MAHVTICAAREFTFSDATQNQTHVRTFRLETYEVPKIVVCGLALRYIVMWLRLDGVDDVWKFDSVLDEEHRNIVAD